MLPLFLFFFPPVLYSCSTLYGIPFRCILFYFLRVLPTAALSRRTPSTVFRARGNLLEELTAVDVSLKTGKPPRQECFSFSGITDIKIAPCRRYKSWIYSAAPAGMIIPGEVFKILWIRRSVNDKIEIVRRVWMLNRRGCIIVSYTGFALFHFPR